MSSVIAKHCKCMHGQPCNLSVVIHCICVHGQPSTYLATIPNPCVMKDRTGTKCDQIRSLTLTLALTLTLHTWSHRICCRCSLSCRRSKPWPKVTRQALAKCSAYKHFVQMSLTSRQNSTDSSNATLWRKKPREYTNVLLGLCSLTTGVIFSFQSSMTFIDKQQWIQNARINHNLLYISTQCALTGEVIMQQKQETKC